MLNKDSTTTYKATVNNEVWFDFTPPEADGSLVEEEQQADRIPTSAARVAWKSSTRS